jgi:hypothetical protein
MHPNWKRLLQIGSAPGWIGVIIFVYRIVGHVIDTASILPAVWNSRLIALWNFLQTPAGDVALAIVGTGWLIALVFWPSLSRKTRAGARPEPIERPVTVPTNPAPPAAVQVVAETQLEIEDTTKPSNESWITAKGVVMQLIPDQAGCTAVLRSGQDIIHARFDKTWLWYLNSLEKGTALSFEGKAASSGQTGHPIDVSDCVCPDGIRVVQHEKWRAIY